MDKVFIHYKDITENDFLESDDFSRKLVHYYKKYVSSCNFSCKEAISKAKELDKAMYNYIRDYYFSKELQSKINVEAIVKDDDTYFEAFIDYLVSFFKDYNPNKRVKPLTRWI